VPTSTSVSGSVAARALDELRGESTTLREAVFWALAAASARDWVYALKWLDLAEELDSQAPQTITRMRREWSRALEREAA
jgi:hypothetical protein